MSSPGQPGTAGSAGPSVGDEDGPLTYSRYLRLGELLSMQTTRAVPPAHDELLFITAHQIHELWFKQMLHELQAARDAMAADRVARACRLLRRVHVIEGVLIAQVDVLETMTPQDFLDFRTGLAPASGFQSAQFRELEYLSGAKDGSFLDRFSGIGVQQREALRRRLAEPSLWDAFVGVLAARGFPAGSPAQILASLVSVARAVDEHEDVWQLAEDLLTHDELAGRWRARHAAMVERQIGAKSGTGGSSGAPYLQARVPLRYYPLLWELRDHL